MKVGKTEVDDAVVARIINAARHSLLEHKKAEGNMFPPADRKALETIDRIDFENDLWRL
jgi:hypothetical protein